MRIALLLVLASGCKSEPDRWEGFFYPDRHDLSISGRSRPLPDLQSCRSWAAAEKSRAERAGFTDTDYECGKNCKPSDLGGDLSVCEETVR